jgi:hypothetical protein
MLSITSDQYASLDRGARDCFYADLDSYLAVSFPHYDINRRSALIQDCRAGCEALGIKNEDGIHAYHVLSFVAGASIGKDPDYQAAHRRYVLIGNPPDQLPLDLHSALATWAG